MQRFIAIIQIIAALYLLEQPLVHRLLSSQTSTAAAAPAPSPPPIAQAQK